MNIFLLIRKTMTTFVTFSDEISLFLEGFLIFFIFDQSSEMIREYDVAISLGSHFRRKVIFQVLAIYFSKKTIISKNATFSNCYY